MSTNINNDNLPDIRELEQLANLFFKSGPGGFQNTLPDQQAAEQFSAPANVTDVGLFNPYGQVNAASPIPSSTIGDGGISPSAINQNNAVNLHDPQTSFADPNLNAHPNPSTPVQFFPSEQLNAYSSPIPPSTIGDGGISPSAINQNNAVNLQDPQTSFADPNLNAHPNPSAPVQLFPSEQVNAASPIPSSTIGDGGISPSAINQNNAVNLKDPQTSFADPHLNANSNPSAPVQGNNPNGYGFGSQLPVQPGFGYESYLVKTDLIPDVPLKQSFPIEQLSFTPENLIQLPYQQDQAFDTDLRKILSNIHTSGPSFTGAPAAAEVPFYFLAGNYGLPAVKADGRNTSKAGLSSVASPPFDVNLVRRDFPILQERVNGKQLVWFDNAATTQKPKQVIERISYFYEHENSNIHRAAHELAARATDAYEGARKKVQTFLNARSINEIIFVRGATEAINLVAKSWGEQNLNAGDEIIVSHLEHHANIVPWQQLAAKKGLKIKVIPVDDDGQLLIDEFAKLLGPKTKLVSFTQVSNALGTVTPAAQIVHLAHLAGARVLVDGAQSVSHMPVDVQALNADWFVFSGHKVFGPTGIGVLYGKEDLLNETQPWQGGGNMIKDVTFEHTQYHDAPGRFEAGTGNIADAVGLGAAIDYVSRLGMPLIAQYEHYLLVYATQLLKGVKGLRLIGTAPDKASVLSFVLDGYKTEDVGAALNQQGIAVRSGHHCAQPILRRFGVESTVRPSLAFYNTCAEIDLLVNTLHSLKR
ncbi:family 2A encapsulin nanocompartment cargo protein cysteine desulfurase [Mucilaginibacter aquaedulcis]|uniref:family 2A encapsulin nanocompartment cargo protein cysteine desulfurase n=1 Tax=Mucilaginibacter aquaedulcis TaxID=1187081 RepID=UPI0025B441A6|nr:family 2A encapsulin nanocompartment cargo protein cysteine desulfurase [Mucilaginibacter aquaedulcis]MDN3547426.1 family 2A encapsulin nanocompartment cargo protein cysteine desulfurase [Mucilaginibacter aquaedulcis]